MTDNRKNKKTAFGMDTPSGHIVGVIIERNCPIPGGNFERIKYNRGKDQHGNPRAPGITLGPVLSHLKVGDAVSVPYYKKSENCPFLHKEGEGDVLAPAPTKEEKVAPVAQNVPQMAYNDDVPDWVVEDIPLPDEAPPQDDDDEGYSH